ncbi:MULTISPECIES: phospholipase D family protein [unclassified Niallia]|uniref:phospholipase D family protein n=1 Tax=unclassified Niallia TaxID=2837522 RepID=UPI001EDC172B|nr:MULTISPECIES: phospholipase D family protein [unclassified Niallia]MDL0434899.1 phospholipase D family protein [Niallia sp. SS-2023]UPO89283.1 phospholipase D family protein [Niallia sp. Man26]
MRITKKLAANILVVYFAVYISVIVYHTLKPLPQGLSYEGEIHLVEDKDIEFVEDTTYKDKKGNQHLNQEIIARMLDEVDKAEQFIVIDMFLFNSDTNDDQTYPKITEKFLDKLVKKKQKNPDLKLIFITDPVNTTYHSYPSPELEKLKSIGAQVVETNMESLRDSNPLYSAFWRMSMKWFGHGKDGHLPNLLADSGPDVTLRSYLDLLNVKANHRKVLITEKSAIVSSGNIHDASGYHSNIAYTVKGNIINDLLETEESVYQLMDKTTFPVAKKTEEKGDIKLQLLTEGKIAKHVIQEIHNTAAGDTIWIGMLYLADRPVMEELIAASARDVNIRLILDPNQNSFGNKKAGLPNVPTSAELMKKGNGHIAIRWYNTGMEQYHSKLMLIERDKENVIIAGSANYTRRNLHDLNLETNIKIAAAPDKDIMKETKSYFDKLWSNKDGEYTKNYSTEAELPAFRYLLYRLQRLLWFTTY